MEFQINYRLPGKQGKTCLSLATSLTTSLTTTLATTLSTAALALSLALSQPGLAASACQSASSDPDGDGWGWEHNQSCIVVSAGSGSGVCASATSDPDGDGWGWENNRSCRVSGDSQPSNDPADGVCSGTAELLDSACTADVTDDFLTRSAICLNITDSFGREACRIEARAKHEQAEEECGDVTQARLQVCDVLGETAYDPPFAEQYAANFVDPRLIGSAVMPNPYFPLVEGNTWVYEKDFIDEDGEEVIEVITIKVTDKTKRIQGIDCVVVTDVVEVDGDALEITDDWYAQDLDGNVWYCGEVSRNYDSFDGDRPEEAELEDLDGSWKAGRDGDRAGIQFPAVPVIGSYIRQEISWTEAEDIIEILSLTGSESSAAASCNGDCLVTRDFTPLEPGANENKYYKPGVGLIVETKPGESERLELKSYDIH